MDRPQPRGGELAFVEQRLGDRRDVDPVGQEPSADAVELAAEGADEPPRRARRRAAEQRREHVDGLADLGARAGVEDDLEVRPRDAPGAREDGLCRVAPQAEEDARDGSRHERVAPSRAPGPAAEERAHVARERDVPDRDAPDEAGLAADAGRGDSLLESRAARREDVPGLVVGTERSEREMRGGAVAGTNLAGPLATPRIMPPGPRRVEPRHCFQALVRRPRRRGGTPAIDTYGASSRLFRNC